MIRGRTWHVTAPTVEQTLFTCVGPGIRVPAKVNAGTTRFGTRLAPGEGTILRLEQ